MNGKPGTRAEVAALKAAVKFCDEQGLPFATDLQTLYEKLTTPFKPRKEGPDLVAAQDRLVAASGGRIIPVEGANEAWWRSLGARCVDRGITDETLDRVGRWLGAQPWATGMTIDRVMSGWPSYLARAKAETNGQTVYGGGGRRDFDPNAQ